MEWTSVENIFAFELAGNRVQAREDLHLLVLDALEKCAKRLVGGEIHGGLGSDEGAFYPATVLEEIPENAKMRQEEVFGPVAALYRVTDLNAAIELANSTRFGLGAGFWSTDQNEIREATLKLQAGSVFVNALVSSQPQLPFGGVKASGYGRELGVFGLHEFTNVKTILVVSG